MILSRQRGRGQKCVCEFKDFKEVKWEWKDFKRRPLASWKAGHARWGGREQESWSTGERRSRGTARMWMIFRDE